MIRIKTRTYFDDPPAVPPPPPPPPPPAKTFTQADVDKMMAEHRKGLQKTNEDLVAQLETWRNKANLTEQEKADLDARIQTLSQQHLTEAQRLQQQVERAEKKYKEETEALTQDSRKWRGSYEKLLVTNGILAGAQKHQAANAGQLEAMLLPKAKVVEEVGDDGKPTGNFVAKLPVTILDPKTKKMVTVELPIEEAIGEMRKDPTNANLFLVDGKPGFGGDPNVGGGAGGGQVDWAKLTPLQHREMRKKLGLDKR